MRIDLRDVIENCPITGGEFREIFVGHGESSGWESSSTCIVSQRRKPHTVAAVMYNIQRRQLDGWIGEQQNSHTANRCTPALG